MFQHLPVLPNPTWSVCPHYCCPSQHRTHHSGIRFIAGWMSSISVCWLNMAAAKSLEGDFNLQAVLYGWEKYWYVTFLTRIHKLFKHVALPVIVIVRQQYGADCGDLYVFCMQSSPNRQPNVNQDGERRRGRGERLASAGG